MRVVGRLFDPEGFDLGEVDVVVHGEQELRVRAGARGDFRIDLPGHEGTLPVTLERGGRIIGQRLISPGPEGGEFVIEIPPRGRPQRSASALAVDRAVPRPLKEPVVGALREQAGRLGLADSLPRIEGLYDELDALSALGLEAVAGSPEALERLQLDLAGEIPFDFGSDLMGLKSAPGDVGINPCQSLPSSPWAPVFAGAMLDQQLGAGTRWAGRAVSAILRRSEPVMRVSRALSGLQAGHVDEPALRTAIQFAGVVADSQPGEPVTELLRRGSRDFPAPERLGRLGGFTQPGGGPLGPSGGPPLPGGGGLPPLGGELPPLGLPAKPGLGTLIDPCNLEWLNCLGAIYDSPPAPTPDPPAVGAIAPTDLTADQAGQLTLTPAAAGGFGAARDQGWSIALGATPLDISDWSPDHVVLEVPATPAGCYDLRWLIDVSAGSAFFNNQSAACAGFFGQRPQLPPVLPKPIGKVSVVGAPKVTFTANNAESKVVAQGCQPATIAWSIDRLLCTDSTTATFDLAITDDQGNVIDDQNALKGSVQITAKEDRTYTLTASNTLPGQPSKQTVVKLEVERVQEIAKLSINPDRPLDRGEMATVTVELSCEADDDVDAVVTSSNPDRFPGARITIPAGQRTASAALNAGGACGAVRLSAVLDNGQVGQPQRTKAIQVHDPTFAGLISANLEQCDGGTIELRFTCTLSVAGVGLAGPRRRNRPEGPHHPDLQPVQRSGLWVDPGARKLRGAGAGELRGDGPRRRHLPPLRQRPSDARPAESHARPFPGSGVRLQRDHGDTEREGHPCRRVDRHQGRQLGDRPAGHRHEPVHRARRQPDRHPQRRRELQGARQAHRRPDRHRPGERRGRLLPQHLQRHPRRQQLLGEGVQGRPRQHGHARAGPLRLPGLAEGRAERPERSRQEGDPHLARRKLDLHARQVRAVPLLGPVGRRSERDRQQRRVGRLRQRGSGRPPAGSGGVQGAHRVRTRPAALLGIAEGRSTSPLAPGGEGPPDQTKEGSTPRFRHHNISALLVRCGERPLTPAGSGSSQRSSRSKPDSVGLAVGRRLRAEPPRQLDETSRGRGARSPSGYALCREE